MMKPRPSLSTLAIPLLFCLFFPSASYAGLDQKLDALYNEVETHFLANPWFKNMSDPELNHYAENAGADRLPPEYAMPRAELFKKALKSYCALRESQNGKKITRLDRFTFVDYTPNSNVRRLYVYDIPHHQFIHNEWTSHGSKSSFNITLQLSDIGLPLADPILNLNYAPTGTFFSNLPDSNQSSVGMTLTESETYWSTNWNCNALRMNGVDGVLNNTILSRAIVIHGFDFSASDVAWDAQTPTSWGCVMLPKSGFFEGTPSAPIADLIIRDIIGGPVLLYHDRLDPKINEQDYQAELQFYEKLKSMIADQIAELSTKYGWSPEQASGYLEQLHVKLREKLMPRVDATYAYFKTPSLYVGVELKSEDACEKVLGLN